MKKVICFICHISFTILFLLFLDIVKNTYNTHNTYLYLSYSGNLFFIWGIVCITLLNNALFNPTNAFFASFYIFQFGQSALYCFGIEHTNSSLYTHYGFKSEVLIESQIFTILCLIFLIFGVILSKFFSKYRIRLKVLKDINNEEIILNSMRLSAIILFIVSIVPYISYVYDIYLYAIKIGYGEMYSRSLGLGALDFFRGFFFPSLILLVLVYKNKVLRRLIYLLAFIHILIIFIAGNRAEPMALLFMFIFVHHYSVKKFTKKQVFIIGGILSCVILILPIISVIRNLPNKNISMIFESLTSVEFSLDLFNDTILEMGFSMFPLINVISIVPSSMDYQYGTTYLGAILDMVLIGPIFSSDNFGFLVWLSQWLQEQLSMNYGPGFSMVAEAYLNFGKLGCFVFLVGGYFLDRVFNLSPNITSKYKLRVFIVSGVIFYSIANVRGQFVDIFKGFYFFFILTYLMIYILTVYLNKGGRNEKNNGFYTNL